jgi:acyl-CoA thioesterase
MIAAYDADTHVEPTGAGRYAATLTDRWSALGGGTNGGYALGVCVAALAQELPHPDPLVVSAYFLRRGAPGPAEVRTDVARTGRRLATGEARLVQDGQEVVRAVATFTDLAAARGHTLMRSTPPDLPPPGECADLMAGRALPDVTIADRIEYRARDLPGWADGRPSGDSSLELWMRFADGRDADALSLPMLVDAAAPAVLELGEAGSATLELTVHVRARPAPGWLACRVSTRHVIGGFHEEDFEIWDAEGNLVAQSRQLGLLP